MTFKEKDAWNFLIDLVLAASLTLFIGNNFEICSVYMLTMFLMWFTLAAFIRSICK